MMTDLQMNQAIQKGCGWEWSLDGHWKNKQWPGKYHEAPDYLNDLNAVHEAEEQLPEMKRAAYLEQLWNLNPSQHSATGLWNSTHATAKQRAEAMCRTLFPERFKE